MRIILGQFDQNMAAKVFCCVSKTLVVSLRLWGVRLVLTAWSERAIGLESGLLEAEVLRSLLFPLRRELSPGFRTVQS